MAIKVPCVAATAGNITLSGEQTVDGVACVTGDRVLVWRQTVASANGIYVADTGSWTRSLDFDGTNDTTKGTLVFVIGGTYATRLFELTTSSPVIGTSSLTFQAITPVTANYALPTVFDFGSFTTAQIADIVSFTGALDVTIPLNTAFAYAANNSITIRMPAGKYTITDTLWATPEGSVLKSFHIIGDGGGYSSGNTQTYIDATAITSKPAINMQSVRGGRLSGVYIKGGNVAPAALGVAGQTYGATWVTGGLRDSQWSPYCGVAVDAGMGSLPADGGYSGFTYRNTSSGSAAITFEDVIADQFVVGFMINPEVAGAQGDGITWIQCRVNGAKVGVAIGTSQARVATMVGGNISNCRDVFSGGDYGGKQGASLRMDDVQIGNAFQCFAYGAGFGTFSMSKCRTESVRRIGQATGGTNLYPIIFTDCDFALLNSADGNLPANILECAGPVIFDGGAIHRDGTFSDTLNMIGLPVTLKGTTLFFNNRFKPFAVGTPDMTFPVVMEECRVHDASGAIANVGTKMRKLSAPARSTECHHVSPRRYGAILYDFIPGNDNNYYNLASCSAFVWGATTLVFDATVVTNLFVGDILFWTMLAAAGTGSSAQNEATLKVTSIVGTTVTCSLLCDAAAYNQAVTPASVPILTHEWAPGTTHTGDVTSGSPTVANVSPTTVLQNGDWIKGRGIPSQTRVTAGAGTATVTLSKNATITNTGVSLYYGTLQQISPVTPRFGDSVVRSTANFTLGSTDGTLIFPNTGLTATLPAASVGLIGRTYTVKLDSTSTSGTIQAGAASQTIDGTTSYALSAAYSSVQLQCSSSAAWSVV